MQSGVTVIDPRIHLLRKMDCRIKPARDPLDTLTLLNWLPTPACPTMRASSA